MNRVVVGVSGRGRSLENFIQQQNKFAYKVVGVFSNKNCDALELARSHGLAVFMGLFDGPSASSDFEDWLREQNAQWIALAGFLKKCPTQFRACAELGARIVNIHPSLIPEFSGPGMYGLRVHKAVVESGRDKTGATVHFVDDIYDHGKIISQEEILIAGEKDPRLLAERVFQLECQLYPKTLDALVKGNIYANHS